VGGRGGVLLDDDLLGLAEHVERDVLELDAEVLGDQLTAGQDRHVLEHRLATITEAGRLDGGDLEAAAQLVDDQGGQRLALDVLGHDQERLARLHDRLEHRQHRLQARELLLEQQDVGALELGDHLVGVGDEVRREIAAASTVAVVVPSPAMSLVLLATSRTIWAPMFSNLSASSISLATVTPSLVMRGAPKLLSSTTLRPFGPSVTLTASARISTPRS